jgi:hypothetical protein
MYIYYPLFTLSSSKQILLFYDTVFGHFESLGLLAITLGAGSSSREIMEESHPQLCRILQAWSDASKMISVCIFCCCHLTSNPSALPVKGI